MDEPTKNLQEERAPGRRVLVVDDSLDAAKMMKLILNQEGYEVRTAHDGPDALEAAKDQPPDIVLLDVELPTMGGVEVAMELRTTEGLEDVTIVAVSGYGRQDLPDPSPFDHHLTKPVDPERLVRFLSKTGKPAGPRPAGETVTRMFAEL